MIVQLRLDERLLHGQVAARWTKQLKAEGIICANDRVASDEFAKKMLLMAAPAKVKVIVKTVDGAIQMLKDPRSENMRIFVLVDNPADALKMAKELNIQDINIANHNKKKDADKVQLTPTVGANPQELEVFKELAKLNAHVFYQVLPEHDEKLFSDVLKDYI